MELVYLWVEKYKNISDKGFNFSPRFKCEFFPVYENGKLKEEIKLNHGHCLIMYGKTQKEWFHGIPKEENINEERINLTFRFTHVKKMR